MESPFDRSHSPMACRRSVNSGWILPFGIGPMFSRKLALLPAARTRYWINCVELLKRLSLLLYPHAPLMVSQVSSGRLPISDFELKSDVRPPGRSFSNI